MSIADKLTTIAENVQKVYEAGKAAGGGSSGDDWYDTFWDAYQKKGNRTHWVNAFSNQGWDDVTYNPKYTAVKVEYAYGAFAQSKISDTKMLLDFSPAAPTSTGTLFQYCRYLKTVRTITVKEDLTYSGWFSECNVLEHISFAGVIGRNIDFSYSPLSVDSMKSVISCLKNYAGTDYDGDYKVTFNENCWSALEASGSAPDGGTWSGYVMSLGWIV